MSGRIAGGSPWTRDAIRSLRFHHPEELEAAEALIPDGAHVTLTCGPRPGVWGGVLVRDGRVVAGIIPQYHSIPSAVAAVMAAAR